MFKIQILNNIATPGLNIFLEKNYKIDNHIASPDGILLRSFNMHDMNVPESVRIIGRAGAGTNNIPINKLTELGIPVLNTPGANANAVKELVIAGMLLACRNICSARDYVQQIEGNDQSLKEQVEKNKKHFSGFELPGKTMGVIGLGNIGVKVANAARYLGMNVIGYDPAMTVKNAWELRSSVQKAEQVEEVFKKSDFISLHIPLVEATKHFISDQQFHLMKKGVILLNLARDGIVDPNALLNALENNEVRSYVCDFPNNQFKNHPKVISLPHLGASTQEAEENCAVMIAQQVRDYLENGHISNSVNFPNIKMSRTEGYRMALVNKNVPNMVAQISTILSNSGINIIDMINKSRNQVAYTLIDINQKVSDDLLKQMMGIDGIIQVRTIPTLEPCKK